MISKGSYMVIMANCAADQRLPYLCQHVCQKKVPLSFVDPRLQRILGMVLLNPGKALSLVDLGLQWILGTFLWNLGSQRIAKAFWFEE